jgi:hypothetical protein
MAEMMCPDIEAMEIAAEWLETYEAEPGGEEAERCCKHVATWLRQYGRKCEERAAAREMGCSVRYLRRMVRGVG